MTSGTAVGGSVGAGVSSRGVVGAATSVVAAGAGVGAGAATTERWTSEVGWCRLTLSYDVESACN